MTDPFRPHWLPRTVGFADAAAAALLLIGLAFVVATTSIMLWTVLTIVFGGPHVSS